MVFKEHANETFVLNYVIKFVKHQVINYKKKIQKDLSDFNNFLIFFIFGMLFSTKKKSISWHKALYISPTEFPDPYQTKLSAVTLRQTYSKLAANNSVHQKLKLLFAAIRH